MQKYLKKKYYNNPKEININKKEEDNNNHNFYEENENILKDIKVESINIGSEEEMGEIDNINLPDSINRN